MVVIAQGGGLNLNRDVGQHERHRQGRRRRALSSCRCGPLVWRLSATTPSCRHGSSPKLYAPQVAKHLKEGRLKGRPSRWSQSKTYQYSHLAKVVPRRPAGVTSSRHEGGGTMSREDLVDHGAPRDSARVGVDRERPQEGHSVARHDRLHGALRRTARHGRRRHQRVSTVFATNRLGRSWRGVGRYFGSPSSRRRSASLWPSRRSGFTTTSPAAWSTFNVEMDNSSSELVDYFIKEDGVRSSPGSEVPGIRRSVVRFPNRGILESRNRGNRLRRRIPMAMDVGGLKKGGVHGRHQTSRRSSTSCWCCSSS